jgi:hypothetical protein
MDPKITVGDVVKLKSDKQDAPQLMSVFSIEGDIANLRWFDQHRFLQKESMPIACLEKV